MADREAINQILRQAQQRITIPNSPSPLASPVSVIEYGKQKKTKTTKKSYRKKKQTKKTKTKNKNKKSIIRKRRR